MTKSFPCRSASSRLPTNPISKSSTTPNVTCCTSPVPVSEYSAPQRAVQGFLQILLVCGHVLFYGALARPGRAEVQRDPPCIFSVPEHGKERREINAPGSQELIQVHPVVLFLAGCRSSPSVGDVVLRLAVLQMDGGDARIVVSQAFHGIDSAER